MPKAITIENIRLIRINERRMRADALAFAAGSIAGFVRRLAAACTAWRQARLLATLDDHTLIDIGFSPAAVRAMLRQPLWAREPLHPRGQNGLIGK